MDNLHSLLKKQLEQFPVNSKSILEHSDLLRAINAAYWQFDADRGKLEQSEILFRALFELSPDAVLIIDPHDPNTSWPIIDCNLAACTMNGYHRDELIGQSIDVLNVTAATETDRSLYMKHLREAGNLKLETHHRHKNGVMFPVEVSTALITIGERELLIGIDRDITKRRQVEQELRQSEERFKLMAWATKDAVWDWDLLTDQIWWGEGLQKVFHYSSEIAPPTPEWRLEHIHPEDRAKVTRVIDQALDGGMEFWSKEYRFQRNDGTYADIMDRGYIIRDDIGKAYRMIGAMLDITERKYMESTLLQANEQMSQFLNELQRRNREIVLLNEMSRSLQACQSAGEAYGIIVDLSNQLFPGTAGALYLFNIPRTLVSAVASWGELPDVNRMFARDDCLALRRGVTHPLREDQTGWRCNHLAEPLPPATLCLPMQVHGEVFGILHLQSQAEENLDESKRELAYIVVEQAAMALSNLKLREALRDQSIRDPLTGLYNRRYMEEALKQQLSRVTRQLHPLGIVMVDIDHFKNFNDTYGHATGDALLRKLGLLLQGRVRGEDIACRYGGEEFILIMPDASLETAQQRAENLRQEARQLRVQDSDQSLEGITLSLGVAIYPEHGRTIENVLRAADSALYRAKQDGRDRVVVAAKVD